MRFWDASAIVPLLVNETGSPAIETLFREDPGQVVWCLTEVEISSALARRDREGALEVEPAAAARDSLRKLAQSWEEVVSVDAVRSRAIRLLRTHALSRDPAAANARASSDRRSAACRRARGLRRAAGIAPLHLPGRSSPRRSPQGGLPGSPLARRPPPPVLDILKDGEIQ